MKCFTIVLLLFSSTAVLGSSLAKPLLPADNASSISFANLPSALVHGGSFAPKVIYGYGSKHGPAGGANVIDVLGGTAIVQAFIPYATQTSLGIFFDYEVSEYDDQRVMGLKSSAKIGDLITIGGPDVNLVTRYYNDHVTLPTFYNYQSAVIQVRYTGNVYSMKGSWGSGPVQDYAAVTLRQDPAYSNRAVLIVFGVSGYATRYASEWLASKILDGSISSFGNRDGLVLKITDSDGNPDTAGDRYVSVEELTTTYDFTPFMPLFATGDPILDQAAAASLKLILDYSQVSSGAILATPIGMTETYGYLWTRNSHYVVQLYLELGLYDRVRSYFQFLKNAQLSDGHWAWCYEANGQVRYDAAIEADGMAYPIVNVYQYYMKTGDLATVQAYYPMLQKAVNFILTDKSKTGEDQFNRALGLVVSEWDEDSGYGWSFPKNSIVFSHNVLWAYGFECMKKLAQLLGDTSGASVYGSYEQQVKNGIQQHFWNSQLNTFGTLIHRDGSLDMTPQIGVTNLAVFPAFSQDDPKVRATFQYYKPKMYDASLDVFRFPSLDPTQPIPLPSVQWTFHWAVWAMKLGSKSEGFSYVRSMAQLLDNPDLAFGENVWNAKQWGYPHSWSISAYSIAIRTYLT
jgi:hypothetical protein